MTATMTLTMMTMLLKIEGDNSNATLITTYSCAEDKPMMIMLMVIVVMLLIITTTMVLLTWVAGRRRAPALPPSPSLRPPALVSI